jgi:hypothetical protein
MCMLTCIHMRHVLARIHRCHVLTHIHMCHVTLSAEGGLAVLGCGHGVLPSSLRHRGHFPHFLHSSWRLGVTFVGRFRCAAFVVARATFRVTGRAYALLVLLKKPQGVSQHLLEELPRLPEDFLSWHEGFFPSVAFFLLIVSFRRSCCWIFFQQFVSLSSFTPVKGHRQRSLSRPLALLCFVCSRRGSFHLFSLQSPPVIGPAAPGPRSPMPAHSCVPAGCLDCLDHPGGWAHLGCCFS